MEVDGILYKWNAQLGIAADPENSVIRIPRIDATNTDHLAQWFVHTFSNLAALKKAAKKRLQTTLGQTTVLDSHFEQIRRDVEIIDGCLDDDSQVDNILDLVSGRAVDELVAYKGLGAVARDNYNYTNPKTAGEFHTGIALMEWLLEEELAYIEAVAETGATHYRIG